ncbi:MAG: hypothetical protein NZ581_02270 [Candidatus Caldarchaeum sp.]|nr:hypothetical protein [Candidatus Caldarchaeum sp.]MDW8435011.1 hypothetical protein [Candidatus Caldarchaeum sp.]
MSPPFYSTDESGSRGFVRFSVEGVTVVVVVLVDRQLDLPKPENTGVETMVNHLIARDQGDVMKAFHQLLHPETEVRG